MGEFRNVAEVIKGARDALELAQLGYENYQKEKTPTRRVAGLLNAVVFGRAVTNVLEHIKTFHRTEFPIWYAPKSRELAMTPHFKYLYELRSEILKEGRRPPTKAITHIEKFRTEDIAHLQPPPGQIGFGIGDELGGAGWLVRRPDGELEKFYADLPSGVRSWTHFASPAGPKNAAPPQDTIDAVLHEYLTYLDGLIDDADAEFGHK